LSPTTKVNDVVNGFKATDGSASMSVAAAENSDHLNAEQDIEETAQSVARILGAEITEKVLQKNGFLITYKHGTRMHYMRVVFYGNLFRMLNIEYDQALKDTYDSIAAHILEAFGN